MSGKLIALHDQRELHPARPAQGHEVTATQFNSSAAARTARANGNALAATLSRKLRASRIRQPQLHRAQPCGVQVLAVATDPGGDPRLFVVVFNFQALHVTRYM